METLEEMQARHRKEKRDLQSVVTNKKKGASKKARKGVNAECDELERRLEERQGREIALLENGGEETRASVGGGGEGEVEEVTDGVGKMGVEEEEEEGDPVPKMKVQIAPSHAREEIQGGGDSGGGGVGKKRNRQKERLARRQAEQLAAAEAAEEEASNMVDRRGVEREKMKATFERHSLVEREIRPDGHCLFSAVADQLEEMSIPLSKTSSSEPGYKQARVAATSWMESHADDFAPFLEEPLDSYVEKIRDTAEWGGQLELAALANAYGVEIRVVQDGEMEEVRPSEPSEKTPVVWLAYYRHGYGLGEHYNSLRKSP